MHWNPTSITFIGYLIVMVAVGIVAWRFTRNFNDYILGGRSLGSVVTALSVGASDMSGWLLMGLPGAVFLSGVCESWIAIGLWVGTFFNWKIVAAPLREYTEVAHNALTLPDFLTHRFEDKSRLLRIIPAIVILLFFAIYSASGMVAAARLFESVFSIPYSEALVYGTIATLAYVFLGGFLAVSWTDTIQATMMCIALIVAPIAVMIDLGGFTATVEQVRAVSPTHVNMLEGQTLIGIISLLAWGLGYFGQPHILVRFMAAKSIRVIPNAFRISMFWLLFCLAGAVAAGFFGSAYFSAHPELAGAVTANHERVFMELSTTLFNPWIGGILLSAILAAVMSTLSCQLLVCSSVLTEDFYRAFIRPSAGQKELVWMGRLTVIAVSAVAIVIAADPTNLVLSLVSYAWGGFGAAFGPIVILSLLWKGCTRNGAVAGIVVGALTVLIWHQGGWFGLYEIIPGFAFSLIAIVAVSLLDPNKPSASVLKTFDEVQSRLEDARKQI
jgi:sodium/proline symporter